MSRIQQVFLKLHEQNRKALIPFVTAGFPSLDQTVPILHALVKAGADVIELGVPFSDPMADGPVIQRASEVALANKVGLRHVFNSVKTFRLSNQHTPIVLMGYANPIERMGIQTFVDNAQQAGVDGVLVVDYPPEEAHLFVRTLKQADLDPIFLLAPTSTEDRIHAVAQFASGYVYYVSLRGVTGASHIHVQQVSEKVSAIRKIIRVPIGVGFGISDAQSACSVAQSADAVVIGSALIAALEKTNVHEAPKTAEHFLAPIRAALDQTFN